MASRGLDAAVSQDGQRWYIGTDGRAYRWFDEKKAWVVHGSRTDLARIDAGNEGAAALSKSGELYVTSRDPGDSWRPTGVRAADVGIGGGRIWLADAVLPGGGRAVFAAKFDASAKGMEWRELPGRLERIDVDPQGRPWGLDKEGRLYVFAGEKWIEDGKAPAGADIGIGGNGTLYLVARQGEVVLGGGGLHRRNPGSGSWSAVPGRLSAVSVDPDGRAFGVNSLSWVLTNAKGGGVAAPRPKPPDADKPGDGTRPKEDSEAPAAELILADLAGDGIDLPATISLAVVRPVRGDPKAGLFIGETDLNGLPATVARFTPKEGSTPTLVLGHRMVGLGDYVPDLRSTGFRDLRLNDAVFLFVPEDNARRKPTPADGRLLSAAFRRDDVATLEPAAGITLLSTLDLKDVPDASLVATLLGTGTGSGRISLKAEQIDQTLFVDVVPGKSPLVSSAPAQTLEALKTKYGTALTSGLVFRAAARELDQRRFGPARISAPVWEFSLAQTEAGVALGIALEADLSFDVRVPAPPGAALTTSPPPLSPPSAVPPKAPGKLPVSASVASPAFSSETLAMKNVRMVFNPRERSARLEKVSITREKAGSLVSYAGFEIESATLDEGSLRFAKEGGAASGGVALKELNLLASAKGKMPSRASGPGPRVDANIELVLDEDGKALVPTLILSGGLNLRDILGDVKVDGKAIPVPDVELTRVEFSPTHMAGTAELYGLPVKLVRYKTAEMAEPVIGIYHQQLDLGNYLPKIREFSLGSFGLTNTVLFVLPEKAPQSVRYDKESMPSPLLALLDREKIRDEDLFPLEIRPGINLIGQYEKNEDGKRSSVSPAVTNSAGKVLSVYGVGDDAYVVKASFKASALGRAGFSRSGSGGGGRGSGSGTGITARDVACGAVSLADAADRTGLDLSFGLPSFSPPYAGSAARFSNARFSLRDVDGELEPMIVTALSLRLPNSVSRSVPGTVMDARVSNNTGIREIGLAAKLRVKGELKQLCTKLSRDSNLEIEVAGSTALNLAQVGNMAFAALQKVAGAAEAVPAKEGSGNKNELPATRTPLPAVKAGAATPKPIGWEQAFGIPFLTVNQLALAGTFAQKDKKRSFTGSLWTDSKVGTEKMDVLGRVTLESAVESDRFDLTDWLLRVPGPVLLTGLPGVKRISDAAPFVTLGDLKVRNLELTPTQSAGKLSSDKAAFTGDLVLLSPADGSEVALYAGLTGFAPNVLLKSGAQLPASINTLTQGKYVVVLRTGNAALTRLGDLPDAVGKMFTDTVGDLVTANTEIQLVRGFSAASRLDPAKIPNQAAYADLKRLLNALALTQPMPVFAGVEVGAGDTANSAAKGATSGPRGFVEAWVPTFALPGAAQLGLSFSNSRIGLNTTDGKTIRLSTDLRYLPPASLTSTLGNSLDMKGTVVSRSQASGDSEFTLSATSNIRWTGPFTLPGLDFSNLGIEMSSKTAGGQRSSEVMLTSDATFRGIEARARLGRTSDGSAQNGNLVELIARNPGELLDLDKLLDPLALLPDQYRVISLSSYLDLKASGLLIASEAGTGRVSIAAEDVSGKINGNAFKGQIAVVGVTTNAPVLFIHSDERLKPAKFLPVPSGPFADLALPKGLVILAPSKADANLSSLHPRIYDKVFTELFGARDAAQHVLMNDGLTVVGKMSLAHDLPSVFGSVASWLPGSGEVVVGGGVEGSQLAFYADVQGVSMTIPVPFTTFVKSVNGNATVHFKTAGADGAGGEVGLGTKAVLRMPRLDTGAAQEVPTEFSLFARVNPGASPTFGIAAKTEGVWNNPLGLDGFSLTDTAVSIGASGTGVTVGIHTEKAGFQGKQFALDLDSAWAGGVPTQLAAQFAKSPATQELIVSPALQAQLVNSVFKLALRGGSNLTGEVQKRLADAGAPSAQLAAFTGFVTKMAAQGTDAVSMMANSPLSMVGIRNPQVFFATPGNSLPPRPGIEQPPFGLGLLATGTLIFDIGSKQIDIANGVYKINLADGFFVSGSITPPSPFNASQFQVSGSQSLIALSPNALRLSGNLQLPGNIPAIGVPASMNGTFDFKRGEITAPGATVSARVSIGSLASRAASFGITTDTVTVYSAPDGCIDIPMKLDGSVSLSNPDVGAILGIAQPVLPDVMACLPFSLADVGAVAETVGNAARDGAMTVINDTGPVGDAVLMVVAPVAGPVGDIAMDQAKLAFNTAQDGVRLAQGGVRVATQTLNTLASVVINPSQAFNNAKATFDSAVQLASQAADALANLGCKLTSWMGSANPCRARERDRRRRKEEADRRAYEAALALEAEKRQLIQQQNEALKSVERGRIEDETRRRILRETEQRVAAEEVARAVNWDRRNAAWCGHDTVWVAGERRCATPDLAYLTFTGDGNRRCLFREGWKSTLRECSLAADMYWKFMDNGAIRGATQQSFAFDPSPPRWTCLAAPVKYERKNRQDYFTEEIGGQVRIDVCSYTGDPQADWREKHRHILWKYNRRGELVSEGGNCVVPDAAGNLFLRACASGYVSGPNPPAVTPPPLGAAKLQWTPVAPVDLAARAGLPKTAKLRVGSGAGALCVGGADGYQEAFLLESCSQSKDQYQYFAFGFDNASQFVIQSRHTRLCLSSGDYRGGADLIGEACFANQAEQFELLGTVGSNGGPVQFKNRKSGLCLAVEGAIAVNAELIEAPCAVGDDKQRFTVQAVADIGAKRFAGAPGKNGAVVDKENFENLRAGLMFRSVGLVQASNGVKLGWAPNPLGAVVNSGLDFAKAGSGSETRFLVVPGRVTGRNRISLVRMDKSYGDYVDGWPAAKVLRHNSANKAFLDGFGKSLSGRISAAMMQSFVGSPDTIGFAANKNNDLTFDLDSSFEVVPGLSGRAGSVSLQSANDHSLYLRFRNGQVYLQGGSDAAFNDSATFFLR